MFDIGANNYWCSNGLNGLLEYFIVFSVCS